MFFLFITSSISPRAFVFFYSLFGNGWKSYLDNHVVFIITRDPAFGVQSAVVTASCATVIASVDRFLGQFDGSSADIYEIIINRKLTLAMFLRKEDS